MGKQDRQGVRSVNDLERKYNFTLKFKTIFKTLSEIEKEIKNKNATHIHSGIPTLENYPAIKWVDNSTRNSHIGDFYYNNDDFTLYIFTMTDSGYEWKLCRSI